MNNSELQDLNHLDTFSKEKIDFCAITNASNPFSPFSCAAFKKCCRKFEKGKRCKKCPKG